MSGVTCISKVPREEREGQPSLSLVALDEALPLLGSIKAHESSHPSSLLQHLNVTSYYCYTIYQFSILSNNLIMARCFIVPPHLLKAISESSANSNTTREAARAAFASHQHVIAKRRKHCLEAARPAARPFVPSHLLRHISQSELVDEASRAAALRTLEGTRDLSTPRLFGEEASQTVTDSGHPKKSPHRIVYDAGHVSSEAELPGKLIRAEGDKEAKDKTANEAYDNVGTVLEFFKDIYDWKSIDDKNADIISSVHFGEEYENACK